MNVSLFTNQICGAGTTDMVYNYAKYNQLLLNNKSRILTLKNPYPYPHNSEVLKKISSELEVCLLDSINDINMFSKTTDVFYANKFGTKDNIFMNGVKNVVHSVFCCNDPHGDVYAYISKYCADKCKWKLWVPPIIDIKNLIHDKNWRSIYNIKESDIIFGRSGSYYHFDIDFVKKIIIEILNKRSDIHFWFVNTEPFYTHPRIKYFNYLSKYDLICFINSCDVMIHARTIGECFGISIAEFSICNKPIVTYKLSNDTAHLELLKECFGYSDEKELYNILNSFEKNTNKNYNFYDDFSPQIVMDIFNKTFLI